MMWRWLIIAPLAVAVGLGGATVAQLRIDTMREEAFHEELLYLPNKHLLTNFTGGLNTVIADILWLQCIQYTAKHFRGDGKYTWLAHMGDVITELDPYFFDAYRYTGMFLASLKADEDASIELMQKGFVNNPDRWELPYEIAMVYLLNRRDEPNSPVMAAHYLKLAVAMGNAPEYVAKVAEGLGARHNLTDIERQMWEETLNHSDDKFMRDLAEKKLVLLDIRQMKERLNEAVQQYEEETGESPEELEQVFTMEGHDSPQFKDPLGGRFFIDPDGEVENTSLLDELVQIRSNRIQTQVNLYKDNYGKYPDTLEALLTEKGNRKIPDHPYPGEEWTYDPATGTVGSTTGVPENSA